jgi:tetratricopeptide (TPR) repeat protein
MLRPAIGDVTIIVGAGISKERPSCAPDFRKIRDTFLSIALPGSEAGEIDTDLLSPEQVFDSLDDSRAQTHEEIRRELWWQCETKSPNRNHAALASMLESGARVWTPNFDTMIERAGATLGIEINAITPDGGDDCDREQRGHPLYKPHGSFPWPGQPPREPQSHQYDLLFQASRVWQFSSDWQRRLVEDLRDRHVFLFGYRGADPDLTPAILEGLRSSRTATWWEFPEDENFDRLRRIFDPRVIQLQAGNPSHALQELAVGYVDLIDPDPESPLPKRVSSAPDYHPTNVARARASGQVLGSTEARRYLRRAAVANEGSDRRRIILVLLRSLAFDRPLARPAIVGGMGLLLRVRRLDGDARLRIAEAYGSLIDSRPIRPSDARAMRRLRAVDPNRPGIAVRLASIAKLHGDLRSARADAERALSATGNEPAMEAMAIYNLAWIYRQQGAFEARDELLGRVAEKRAHIGLNWAAWLAIEDILFELQVGRVEDAAHTADDQMLKFARDRLGHSLYTQDENIGRALLTWHRAGPERARHELEDCYRRAPVGTIAAPRFSSMTNLILLADLARAKGDPVTMRRHLGRARRRCRSRLQMAQIRLVAAAAELNRDTLGDLKRDAERQGFGLIAITVEALLSRSDDVDRPDGVLVRADLPLPALY